MSTAAKSSAGSGRMLSGIFFNDQLSPTDTVDPISEKYMHNKFDDTLVNTKGDMSVVMRISQNDLVLERILFMFKGLAEKINNSLHQIK